MGLGPQAALGRACPAPSSAEHLPWEVGASRVSSFPDAGMEATAAQSGLCSPSLKLLSQGGLRCPWGPRSSAQAISSGPASGPTALHPCAAALGTAWPGVWDWSGLGGAADRGTESPCDAL